MSASARSEGGFLTRQAPWTPVATAGQSLAEGLLQSLIHQLVLGRGQNTEPISLGRNCVPPRIYLLSSQDFRETLFRERVFKEAIK